MSSKKPTKKELEKLFGKHKLEEAIIQVLAPAIVAQDTTMEAATEAASIHYGVEASVVTSKLLPEVEKQSREANVSDEDREAAAKAQRDAAKAQKDADDSKREAEQKAEDARIASAKAVGQVAVNVPKPFILDLGPGQKFTYRVGAQTMPQAHADHWYAKANGVKVIGEK